jgi:5-methylcytosine-specific restriction endonuclease McrA
VICRGCGHLVDQGLARNGRCPDCFARKEAERDRVRASQPQRRAHQTAAHKRLRARVFRRDGGCVDCGATEDLTLDYIVPLQDGGEMSEDNAVTRCRSHNSSAGRRTKRRKQVSVWDNEHDRTREHYGR